MTRDAEGGSLSVKTIAAAEALLGLAFSDEARGLLAAGLAEQQAAVATRRAHVPAFDLQPALRFDPRLPGWTMPDVAGFLPSAAPDIVLPQSDSDIAFSSVAQLGRWLRQGVLTSERLTEIYLARLERHSATLDCIVTVTADRARTSARLADRWLAAGIDRGALHGIPWGAKDLIDTAGIVTSFGAGPYRDRVPAADATIVERLDAAGAVLVAKTALGELAFGDLWYGGRSRNPWNPHEGSSGSSAGSASATAAGLVGFSIGSETLGSIIAPSLRCGVAGMRPTFGRVSRRGAMPLAWSLDKLGPICRTVEDTALVLAAINGFDAEDAGSIAAPFGFDATRSVAGLRIGYFDADLDVSDAPERDRLALAGLADHGARLVPLERPELPYMALRLIMFAEAAAAFEELTVSGRDALLAVQTEKGWPNEFRKARFLSAVDYIQLDRLRRTVMVAVADHFKQVDVIVGPSIAGPLLTIGNFTGHPAIAVPTGFVERTTRPVSIGPSLPAPPEDEGRCHRVPHGVAVMGGLFDEGTMLSVALCIERALGAPDRKPPGF